MHRILITGATGNVGREVINSLISLSTLSTILAAVRNVNEVIKPELVKNVLFDFEDAKSFDSAFQCDVLFLLRPPQLSNVKRYFVPLIKAAKKNRVKHIVFLSVQGVEHSKIIPHHKIEKLIVESRIPYTFLRPAYFMQNFTTTLRADLIEKHLIYLPAGNAKFTLIDVTDIGRTAAIILENPQQHLNKAYELTGNEKLTFHEMADELSIQLGRKIIFKSPTLLQFYIRKRKEGVPNMFILIMIMLHYLPRYQDEPAITNYIHEISGDKPRTFALFIRSNKSLLDDREHWQ